MSSHTGLSRGEGRHGSPSVVSFSSLGFERATSAPKRSLANNDIFFIHARNQTARCLSPIFLSFLSSMNFFWFRYVADPPGKNSGNGSSPNRQLQFSLCPKRFIFFQKIRSAFPSSSRGQKISSDSLTLAGVKEAWWVLLLS